MLVCACRTRSTDHQRVQRYAPFHSTAICARLGIRDSLWMFFAYKKILGRTETRTRERKYLGRIRSVWDISRGDRARIATCSLRTSPDRLKANYSIDVLTLFRCIVVVEHHATTAFWSLRWPTSSDNSTFANWEGSHVLNVIFFGTVRRLLKFAIFCYNMCST